VPLPSITDTFTVTLSNGNEGVRLVKIDENASYRISAGGGSGQPGVHAKLSRFVIPSNTEVMVVASSLPEWRPTVAPLPGVMPLNLGTSDDEQIRYVNIRRHVVDYPGLSRCNTGYGRERYCKQHREARRTLFYARRG
jgi:hypothetical protein